MIKIIIYNYSNFVFVIIFLYVIVISNANDMRVKIIQYTLRSKETIYIIRMNRKRKSKYHKSKYHKLSSIYFIQSYRFSQNLYRISNRDTCFDVYRICILRTVSVIYEHSQIFPNTKYEIDTSSLCDVELRFQFMSSTDGATYRA